MAEVMLVRMMMMAKLILLLMGTMMGALLRHSLMGKEQLGSALPRRVHQVQQHPCFGIVLEQQRGIVVEQQWKDEGFVFLPESRRARFQMS